jgi:hypothetical protein
MESEKMKLNHLNLFDEIQKGDEVNVEKDNRYVFFDFTGIVFDKDEDFIKVKDQEDNCYDFLLSDMWQIKKT